MYTQAALLDMHERVQRNFRRLMEHCRGLSPEEFDRELTGFGYPSVRLQLHHVIGCEEYWVSVLRGSFSVEDDAHLYPTITSLEAYRDKVSRATEDYLRQASETELNTAR